MSHLKRRLQKLEPQKQECRYRDFLKGLTEAELNACFNLYFRELDAKALGIEPEYTTVEGDLKQRLELAPMNASEHMSDAELDARLRELFSREKPWSFCVDKERAMELVIGEKVK